jgi:hypothetical protein
LNREKKDLNDLLIKGYISVDITLDNNCYTFYSLPNSLFRKIFEKCEKERSFTLFRLVFLSYSLKEVFPLQDITYREALEFFSKMPIGTLSCFFTNVFFNLNIRCMNASKYLVSKEYKDSIFISQSRLASKSLNIPWYSSKLTGYDYTEKYGLNNAQFVWSWKTFLDEKEINQKDMWGYAKLIIGAVNPELYNKIIKDEKNKATPVDADDIGYYKELVESYGEEKAAKIMEQSGKSVDAIIAKMNETNENYDTFKQYGFTDEEINSPDFHDLLMQKASLVDQHIELEKQAKNENNKNSLEFDSIEMQLSTLKDKNFEDLDDHDKVMKVWEEMESQKYKKDHLGTLTEIEEEESKIFISSKTTIK